ncbi:hypothetical protein [Hyalangium rubrum]|uniref:Lipoprotein n=1 Tax=Hyalangium rubrum TaxID=3103134 RepID=A0ABU5H1G8_9BACT|nr:hypothetical protein [Hyalangium sp. s54d21]MDY7227298.1 hypothetical protein [Hyalangium sp. s54d21]
MNRPLTRVFLACVALLVGCTRDSGFNPEKLAVGPGSMVGNGEPITSGEFAGGQDPLPAARDVPPPDDSRPPDCDGACVAYCDAANLRNPVNRGLCRSLWGVGLSHRPVQHAEACRRLFVDVAGRVPTAEEAEATCTGNWGETVKQLMASSDFIFVNQRRAADKYLYSNEVVNIQAIYDMDLLVEKLFRGKVPYDQFAAVVSAHPVLTRRHADPGDKVEALFRLFLGRPPFEHERADMSRLYRLWHSGYYDHPQMAMRMPDAYVRFRCLTEDGSEVDQVKKGECTSVLWGYNELVLTPDLRSVMDRQINELTLWNGLLTPDEWALMQTPGRVLSTELAFWERAVDDVLDQYLGYDLSAKVPEVRAELVRWLLDHQGDLRSVHYAVLTSAAYLQSTEGNTTTSYRWAYGPLKQMEAEVWIDSMMRNTGYTMSTCDHRISQPENLLRSGSVAAYRVLQNSRWKIDAEGQIEEDYADLARTLGGCPENIVGGRFRVVSILTTGTQLAFVGDLCNPTLDPKANGAPIERLLPEGVEAARVLTPELATQIGSHQYRVLLGRSPTSEELTDVREAGAKCAVDRCGAEEFARPLCFALLSGAERLFY